MPNNVSSDPKLQPMSIICQNIRSCKSNFNTFLTEIKNHMKTSNLIILTETNLKNEENALFFINNYNAEYVNRKNRRGGGIAVFIKDHLKYEVINEYVIPDSFETLIIKIELYKRPIILICIYRPPSLTNINIFCRELESLITKFGMKDEIIIMGDMNIDILKNNCYVQKYLDMIAENGLMNLNFSEPTRVDLILNTATNIDHALLRIRQDCETDVQIIQTHASDHFAVVLKFSAPMQELSHKKSLKHVLCNNKINSLLVKCNFSDSLEARSPAEIYANFKSKIDNIYSQSLIQKKLTRRKHNMWITPELLKMCAERDKLYKKWKKKPHDTIKQMEYKKYRNLVNKKIVLVKNNFYRRRINASIGDSRKTWQIVNEILGKRRATVDEVILKNFKNTNAVSISNHFANQFEGTISSTCHICEHKVYNRSLDFSQQNSFFLQAVSEDEVLVILRTLNANNGAGIDGIRACDLKHNADVVCKVITKLINECFQKAEIPQSLKVAIVRPIYKDGLKSDVNNYRPIAILPAVEKILETIVVSQISNFLEKFEIIDPRQFGFQKRKNINQLLGGFADCLNHNLSRGIHSLVLFLDFSKAFDTLPHDKLLDALEKCGIRGSCLELFKSYLSNRLFRVKIGDSLSEPKEVRCGVPQGSKLGPLLFIIYSNRFLKIIDRHKVFAYADDTAIVVSHVNFEVAVVEMQNQLNEISKWCHDNGLTINAKKTKLMYVRSPHQRSRSCQQPKIYYTNFCPKVRHNCREIVELVSQYKYLGVIVDENLKWNVHIQHVQKKLRQTSYFLRHLSYCAPRDLLASFYFALGESHIRYGIAAWGSSTHCRSLQLSQNRLLKILKNARVTPNFLNVANLHRNVMVLQYYDHRQYRRKIDHNYKTRKKTEGRYKVGCFYNVFGKNTLECIIPRILNELPVELLSLQSVHLRKRLIKSHMLQHQNQPV